ncbi:MAG: hypothetical protein HYW09_00665 [Candidatus Niyogibacteria bacterium]|nr:hypothetical protein [Candidatus Niyogibacteria bacterium]
MNGENKEETPQSNGLKKPGIRTMAGDVQDYVKEKKLSLAGLAAIRQRREIAGGPENRSVLRRPAYIFSAILILALLSAGIFWLNRAAREPLAPQKTATPPSLIAAGKEFTVSTENGDKNVFLTSWRDLFNAQLLPRQFLYVKIFDKNNNKFLNAQGLFNLLGISPPLLLANNVGGLSTFGIMDTSRGNETVIITEINSYASAFAGLLQWEANLPVDLLPLLRPGLSYDRGENNFIDSVVANNDARLLKNKEGESILGYSIFNQKFLILAQSPQAMENVIKQMSVLPPK